MNSVTHDHVLLDLVNPGASQLRLRSNPSHKMPWEKTPTVEIRCHVVAEQSK